MSTSKPVKDWDTKDFAQESFAAGALTMRLHLATWLRDVRNQPHLAAKVANFPIPDLAGSLREYLGKELPK